MSLMEYKWTVQDNPGDGDCFFYAILPFLGYKIPKSKNKTTDKVILKIRKSCADYVRNEWSDEYLRRALMEYQSNYESMPEKYSWFKEIVRLQNITAQLAKEIIARSIETQGSLYEGDDICRSIISKLYKIIFIIVEPSNQQVFWIRNRDGEDEYQKFGFLEQVRQNGHPDHFRTIGICDEEPEKTFVKFLFDKRQPDENSLFNIVQKAELNKNVKLPRFETCHVTERAVKKAKLDIKNDDMLTDKEETVNPSRKAPKKLLSGSEKLALDLYYYLGPFINIEMEKQEISKSNLDMISYALKEQNVVDHFIRKLCIDIAKKEDSVFKDHLRILLTDTAKRGFMDEMNRRVHRIVSILKECFLDYSKLTNLQRQLFNVDFSPVIEDGELFFNRISEYMSRFPRKNQAIRSQLEVLESIDRGRLISGHIENNSVFSEETNDNKFRTAIFNIIRNSDTQTIDSIVYTIELLVNTSLTEIHFYKDKQVVIDIIHGCIQLAKSTLHSEDIVAYLLEHRSLRIAEKIDFDTQVYNGAERELYDLLLEMKRFGHSFQHNENSVLKLRNQYNRVKKRRLSGTETNDFSSVAVVSNSDVINQDILFSNNLLHRFSVYLGNCRYIPVIFEENNDLGEAADILDFIIRKPQLNHDSFDQQNIDNLLNFQRDILRSSIAFDSSISLNNTAIIAKYYQSFLEDLKFDEVGATGDSEKDPNNNNVWYFRIYYELHSILECLRELGRSVNSVLEIVYYQRFKIAENDITSPTSSIASRNTIHEIDPSIIPYEAFSYDAEITDDSDTGADEDIKSDIGYLLNDVNLTVDQIERVKRANINGLYTKLIYLSNSATYTQTFINLQDEKAEDAPTEGIVDEEEDNVIDTLIGEEYRLVVNKVMLLVLFASFYSPADLRNKNRKQLLLEWRGILRTIYLQSIGILYNKSTIDVDKVSLLIEHEYIEPELQIIANAANPKPIDVDTYRECIIKYISLFTGSVRIIQQNYSYEDIYSENDKDDIEIIKSLLESFSINNGILRRSFLVTADKIVGELDSDLTNSLNQLTTNVNIDTESVLSSDLSSIPDNDIDSDVEDLFSDDGSAQSADMSIDSLSSSDTLTADEKTKDVDSSSDSKKKKKNYQVHKSDRVIINDTRYVTKGKLVVSADQKKIQDNMVYNESYPEKRRPSFFLYNDAGTGKTVTAVLCMEKIASIALSITSSKPKTRLIMNKVSEQTILLTFIIIAKATIQPGWRIDFNKVSQFTPNLKSKRIQIYLITYDQFERLNVKSKSFKNVILIIDEIHEYRIRDVNASDSLSNENNGRIITAINKCSQVNQVLLLSATPIEYGFQDFSVYYLMLLGIPYSDTSYSRIFNYFKTINTAIQKNAKLRKELPGLSQLELGRLLQECLRCRLVRVIKETNSNEFVPYNNPLNIGDPGLITLQFNASQDKNYQKALELDYKNTSEGFSPKARAACNTVDKIGKIITLIENHKRTRRIKGKTFPMKVLIYSQFHPGGLDKIEDAIRNRNHKFSENSNERWGSERMSSSAAHNKNVLDKFNNFSEETEIVLISYKNSEGLNLKNVSLLVIMEPPWTLEKYKQILGRASRRDSHIDTPEELKRAQVVMFIENRYSENSQPTVNTTLVKRLRTRVQLQTFFSGECQRTSYRTLTDIDCANKPPGMCAPSK